MKYFQGKFNWYGESIILETTASDETIAKSNMFYQLSLKTTMDVKFIQQYYRSRPGGWKITDRKAV